MRLYCRGLNVLESCTEIWDSYSYYSFLLPALSLASEHHLSSGTARRGGGGGSCCLGECSSWPGLLGLPERALLGWTSLQEDSDEAQQDTGECSEANLSSFSSGWNWNRLIREEVKVESREEIEIEKCTHTHTSSPNVSVYLCAALHRPQRLHTGLKDRGRETETAYPSLLSLYSTFSFWSCPPGKLVLLHYKICFGLCDCK